MAKASDIRSHVILMDLEMPDMDGLDYIRKLKADPALSDIPVIIFSGKTDSRQARAALEAGAREYITKPIQHDEFLTPVRVRVHDRISEFPLWLSSVLPAKARCR